MGIAKKFLKQLKNVAEDYYCKAWVAFRKSDFDSAAENAELAVLKDPSHLSARLILVDIYTETRKKSKKAIPHLEFLADYKKYRLQAWVDLYNIYVKNHDLRKIEALYQKHIASLNEKDLSVHEKNFILHLKKYFPQLKEKANLPAASLLNDKTTLKIPSKPRKVRSTAAHAGSSSDSPFPSQKADAGDSSMMSQSSGIQQKVSSPPPRQFLIPLPADEDIPMRFSFEEDGVMEEVSRWRQSAAEAWLLKMRSERLTLLEGFDTLLSLEALNGVEKYWYQIETVRKVLKHYRGRVLLCDEVGLGKTVEAGMLMKEYLLRGLIRRVLVLVPPSLVSQWRDELISKFGIECLTTDDEDYRLSPEAFWKKASVIVASINTAKSKLNFEYVTEQEYDLVVVDEAHHVKKKESQNWKLVNAIRKKYIFLLTATPVQNDLTELYNLITLLRPGTLGTPTVFKKEFVSAGDRRKPRNPEKLRELLRQVLIRNIRALVDVKLPPRSAVTFSMAGGEKERLLYEKTSELARKIHREKPHMTRMLLSTLLMEAGSSPVALMPTLIGQKEKALNDYAADIDELLLICGSGIKGVKERKLLEILKSGGGKIIVFVRFRETLNHLVGVLSGKGISCAVFHGSLSTAEKDRQIQAFRDESRVLISTEAGGEGKNLQFCSTLINYDLPWNPMKIEQRIGRLHRIGQTEPVNIFNLCLRDSIESHILSVLEEKINMFQLVIGEIGMIVGAVESEKEFDDIVLDLWLESENADEVKEGFEKLGQELIDAKTDYIKTQELERELLADDFSI